MSVGNQGPDQGNEKKQNVLCMADLGESGPWSDTEVGIIGYYRLTRFLQEHF